MRGIWERWVTSTMTGSSSTSPIPKNIGSPMITATRVMAQTTLLPVACARSVSHDERYADRRDHEQEGVVPGPAIAVGNCVAIREFMAFP
jgi:hypothetical protein